MHWSFKIVAGLAMFGVSGAMIMFEPSTPAVADDVPSSGPARQSSTRPE